MGGLDGVGKAYSVEEPEVPGAGQVVDGFRVGLGGEGEDGLDSDIHDHDTLGAQVERQDFQCVGDEQTRETNGVEDTEDPDEGDLSDTVGGRTALNTARVFELAGKGSPDSEGENHT